jgi:hypothetical protein
MKQKRNLICAAITVLVLLCAGAAAQPAQAPRRPDVKKLRRDLIGRRISDAPNGYHSKGWYWLVESPAELGEVKIARILKSGADYIYDVHLVLLGKNNRHRAEVLVTYARSRSGSWQVETIETKSLQIVRTNRYNRCIAAQRAGWSGEYQLELVNRCDVSLVVGGIVLGEFDGKWHKFATVVDANSTGSVGGLFLVSVREYEIHFIERPH